MKKLMETITKGEKIKKESGSVTLYIESDASGIEVRVISPYIDIYEKSYSVDSESIKRALFQVYNASLTEMYRQYDINYDVDMSTTGFISRDAHAAAKLCKSLLEQFDEAA